jgi:hypothetical protein
MQKKFTNDNPYLFSKFSGLSSADAIICAIIAEPLDGAYIMQEFRDNPDSRFSDILLYACDYVRVFLDLMATGPAYFGE